MSSDSSDPVHTHDWKPIQNLHGRYECRICRTTGYRFSGGKIKEHRSPLRRTSELTVRGTATGRKPLEDWQSPCKEQEE